MTTEERDNNTIYSGAWQFSFGWVLYLSYTAGEVCSRQNECPKAVRYACIMHTGVTLNISVMNG